MKTKVILIFMLFIQIQIINADTQEENSIRYGENGCEGNSDENQTIFFQLEKETLFITGKIRANCCGLHFLQYEVFPDSIHLLRLDEGELCDCYCLYEINIKIENLTSSIYKVTLSEYLNDDGIDIIVSSNQTGLENQRDETIKCFPNPMDRSAVIILPAQISLPVSFVMFDSMGRIVNTIHNVQTNRLSIDRENLSNGIYSYIIYNSDKIFCRKKIIIQ